MVKDETNKEVELRMLRDFYSEISGFINNLNDDLDLDLKYGEHGYKTHKESYEAVKRYTLRLLNRRERVIKKRIEKLEIEKHKEFLEKQNAIK